MAINLSHTSTIMLLSANNHNRWYGEFPLKDSNVHVRQMMIDRITIRPIELLPNIQFVKWRFLQIMIRQITK